MFWKLKMTKTTPNPSSNGYNNGHMVLNGTIRILSGQKSGQKIRSDKSDQNPVPTASSIFEQHPADIKNPIRI
jgi:hypothetical protein